MFTFFNTFLSPLFFQDSSESPPQDEEDSGGGKGEEEGEREKEKGEDEGLDSTGEEKGSPEYVDEERLRAEEEREGEEGALTEAEREGRRTECGKLKQEGNSLYKDGKPEGRITIFIIITVICIAWIL